MPSGWSYHCVSTTTLRNIDGTGWIPINFNLISHGSRISILPIDPVNTASSQNYYTYATGGLSYELTAYFESDKYQTQAAESGNPDPTTYAVGNVSLTPFVHGLVGYWGFDEGGGTTANDSSGFLNTGTMYSSSTITNLHTATNCLSESCVYFDGTDDYINNGATPQLNNSVVFTIIAWVKTNTASIQQEIAQRGSSAHVHGYIFFEILNTGKVRLDSESSSTLSHVLASSADPLSAGQWYQVAGVARTNNLQVYVDEQGGSLTDYSGLYPLVTGDNSSYGRRMNIGALTYNSPIPSSVFNGLIDDVRVYNRALTTAQIQAMYNAGRLR
ncbi:MAG: LamG domain-containing protein [Patescibacteria group bacterium]|nr:LamG domain-containing protein [Patescibacteria group bacterium]